MTPSLFGRDLPHSLEAEEYLLSTCLIDGSDVIAACLNSKLPSAAFFSPANRLIYDKICELYQKGPVELYVLAEELKAAKMLEAVGGYPYLLAITQKVPTSSQASYFIERVRALHIRRELIKAAHAASEAAFSTDGDINELLSEVQTNMGRVLNTQASAQSEPAFTEVATQAMERAQAIIDGKLDERAGTVSWGIDAIDKRCFPMDPGSLVVVGGRPSTGKSALADWTAWQCALNGGPTLMFTYEMSKQDKAIRIAQQVSGCNYGHIRTLPRHEQQALLRAFERIRQCPHLHVFERDMSISQVMARSRAFAKKAPVKLIVLDFLQYLSRMEPTVGKERTDEKIGRITAGAKALARELGCPVMLLSSLSRNSVLDNRPPSLADLRASGEIESDADVVALLHWPATNAVTKLPQDPKDENTRRFYVEFNQEKGRSHGVHQCGLMFDRMATRFDGIDKWT